jgi:hypothetical protein
MAMGDHELGKAYISRPEGVPGFLLSIRAQVAYSSEQSSRRATEVLRAGYSSEDEHVIYEI